MSSGKCKPGEVYPGVTSNQFHGIPADGLTLQEYFDGRASPHTIAMLSDERKKESGEPIYYTPTCSCSWRGNRYVHKSSAWHAADEHVMGAK